MTASQTLRHPAAGAQTAMPAMPQDDRLCLLHLMDRRTGALHRVNGAPLSVLSRTPDQAAAALLQGRDPAQWSVRIDPISPPQNQRGPK